jgi:hypothetical protein
MHRKLITCKVFQDALKFLDRHRHIPQVRTRCLPAHLHLRPNELRNKLMAEISAARVKREGICCLYAECFPGIDETLQKMSVQRVPCRNCYETLVGRRKFRRVLEEQLGTFFLEKELILNFDTYCWYPMELDDPMLRSAYFEHYRRVVYIRQPLDPDLKVIAGQIAHRLDLALTVVDADYSDLNADLNRTLGAMSH